LAHCFPPKLLPIVPTMLRPHQDYEPLVAGEIAAGLRKCLSISAPGPDTIPYSVWKHVHLVFPHLLTDLLNPLLKFCYHSTLMMKANRVILDKHGKPS